MTYSQIGKKFKRNDLLCIKIGLVERAKESFYAGIPKHEMIIILKDVNTVIAHGGDVNDWKAIDEALEEEFGLNKKVVEA